MCGANKKPFIRKNKHFLWYIGRRNGRVVRWLHISDLHIAKRADWINFEKELIKKCHEYDKIDLVIVTGFS